MENLLSFLFYSLINGLSFIGEILFSTDIFFIGITVFFTVLIYQAEKDEIDEMFIEDERDIV